MKREDVKNKIPGITEEQLKVANHRIADLEEHEYERERN